MNNYQTVVVYNKVDSHIKNLLPNIKNIGDILLNISIQKVGDPIPSNQPSMQSVIFQFRTEKEAYKMALDHCRAEYNKIRFDAEIDKATIMMRIAKDFPELLI